MTIGSEGAVDGIACKGPAEGEGAGIGDAGPGIERVRDAHVANIVRDKGCGAIGEPPAIAWLECGFKEGLLGDAAQVSSVVGRNHHVFPGIGEALPVQGQHVGNCGQAVIFNFIGNFAADIAGLGQDFRTELVLDGKSEFI